jgi:hypothetical protein
MRGKVNELLSQLYPTFPHILCLSENHMKRLELQRSHFDNYVVGASYCRTMYEMGGSPIINGLSDHDAQLITLHSYNSRPPSKKYRLIRNINDHTINDFLTK